MRSAVWLLLLTTPAAADNVLVWLDAPLRTDASDAAPSIHLGELAKRTANYVVPMHQLATQGDFVEVEPTADIECAWSKVARPAGLASLRLFVKKTDLAPVVAKPFTASFKDGSRVSLQPGVSVQDGLVAFDDQLVPVDVPNLATAYAPHPIAAVTKPTKHTVLLDEHTDVTFGGKSFQLGPWVAGSAENRGARVLVPIAVRCATVVVSAPKDRVQRDVSLAGIVGVGDAAPRRAVATGYHLPKGQALMSETGTHVVATLAEDHDVAKPSGAMACADFEVTRDEPLDEAPHPDEASRPNRTLHLCAPAAAVKH